MQVVHVHWDPVSINGTGFEEILIPCSKAEIVAHIDVTPEGVRQLMKCHFREGFDQENFSDSEFLEFESTVPSGNDENVVVVFNSHPLTIASVQSLDIAVLPPYTISDDGISITIMGVPSGIRGFLDLARKLFPPDQIKVINEGDEKNQADIFGKRQWEVVQAAVGWGYYDSPRKVTMREMAERLGVAHSTLGEHLKRAEANLMQWFVKNN
ncbi:MAG: helix-turn-helix domain-containing protein [Candidatus Thalassarchaeaceae archaeon]|jgi:hypothetical protein|nr:helix-turn-helix domain-containing protein [Candidatus Thalassarchaeaceae archaeon]